jgi:hypothetical protein
VVKRKKGINGQIYNDLQNIRHKAKDRAKRTQLKTGFILGAPENIRSSPVISITLSLVYCWFLVFCSVFV